MAVPDAASNAACSSTGGTDLGVGIDLGRPTVAVSDLHVVYRVFGARAVRPGSIHASRSKLARLLRTDTKGITRVHAIRGVNFVAREGESIGLIGANGSGKSTLLKAVAGTLMPHGGRVRAVAKPTLLGVDAALIPQLTGARNVEIGCLALGMTPDQVEKHFDEIVEFSGIGEFIDLPMTAYSSGMSARLRFAIASSIPHDILLIDEALATGDAAFRERSEERIRQLRREAGTVFLVSHDLSTVLETCNRGIWLHRGTIRMDGPVGQVVNAYEAEVKAGGARPPTTTSDEPGDPPAGEPTRGD